PAAVTLAGARRAGDLAADTDEHVAALARVVARVHEHTDARIGLWLTHAGGHAAAERMAASAVAYGAAVARAMNRADMDRIRDGFAAAARRAAGVGFDVLAVDVADGSLLASFVSPLGNARGDEYGGPL